jgi:hypothetical protein
MAKLFGFEIKRAQDDNAPESFAPPVQDDGAVVISEGGMFGTYVDMDGTAKTEAELVSRYREMAGQPEVEAAVDDIVNEAISGDHQDIVNINMDDVEGLSQNIKDKVAEEFEEALSLLNFKSMSYDVFRRWYIDGRLYYHAIIDENNPRRGLTELRYIDPRKIRKVKEVKKAQQGKDNFPVTSIKNEYYLYNEKGFLAKGSWSGSSSTKGLKIAKDSIIHCTSGLMDTNNQMVLSYLHKAIKPLNQLRTLEDASVIYRISRAPERRIFYIDVGNLPRQKAEQYIRDMMVKHKNRLVYDGSTGEIRDDRKFMTMMEDYWLPRREGGRGTEITTLPGGQNLGEMDDILYFQKKLYKSLNVPVSRLEQETGFSIGRSAEISRDEVKFQKFVDRLRNKFAYTLFNSIMEKQVVLKNIMTIEDWNDVKDSILYEFKKDNHFSELLNNEILRERVQTVRDMDEYVGKYFSAEYVRKNVLMQTDDEIEEIDRQNQEVADEENQEVDAMGADAGSETDTGDQGNQQQDEPTSFAGRGFPGAK